MNKYDLIIIGAGPAGLTAGIYAARYKLNVLIIGKTLGGLAGIAHEVCNFPSIEKISGAKLMLEMIGQTKKLGVEIKNEDVIEIRNRFEVITSKSRYQAKKIIIATGRERRKLDLKREKEFVGKGVSYCATCDANFYKGKTVAVVGGGNAALNTALLLARMANKVYMIYKQSKFMKGEKLKIEEVIGSEKIKPIFSSNVTNLMGKEKLEEIEINDKEKIKVDGLFIEIGSTPNLEFAEKLKIKLEGDYIIVNKKQKTNIDGIFAAGDVTNNPLKQIVTACAEGAIASDIAYKELNNKSA